MIARTFIAETAKRDKFPTRSIMLVGDTQLAAAKAMLESAPLDAGQPLELLLREQVKARKPDQNAAMWSGPLADIAEQAYVEGRTYSAEVWHEYYKRLYLPEEYDPEVCKDGYRKWDYTPIGERVLVGSTTGLTIKGFSMYLNLVEADGANMGVLFTAPPHRA